MIKAEDIERQIEADCDIDRRTLKPSGKRYERPRHDISQQKEKIMTARNLFTAALLIALDAARYRRLKILGCAPGETEHLKNGNVMRFSVLDAFVDADLKAYPSRGEANTSRGEK